MYKFGVFFGKTFLILFLILILSLLIYAAPDISASSAILINADTGESLFEYNADTKRGMASTTKIMTAIIAIERGNLEREISIPKNAVGIEGSSLYLTENEKMTMRELIIGLMLRSANDAAEAIAIITSGNVDSFVELMNDKAKELGLTNTHFTNPHGLSDNNHYTTARDLATLSAYASKNDIFREICSSKSSVIPGVNGERFVTNHNKMLSRYEGAYGIKTGFTKATGRCLVSAAKRNGVNLIAVTLNAPDDWNDHKVLLDYGFSTVESVTLARQGEPITILSVIGGDTESVDLYAKNEIVVTLKKSRNSIVNRIELVYPKFAPLFRGDEVGKVIYLLDGKEIASSPLCVSSHIKSNRK